MVVPIKILAANFKATGEFHLKLKTIENFVDGAAVKRVGDLNFAICKETLQDVITVDEGKICQTILELYGSRQLREGTH